MKRDYLNGTPYSLYQGEGMFHFNSDTELLGNFMKIHPGDSLLDIGTNNGALLFYGASKGAESLTGIDLFEENIRIAEENMAYNHLHAELHAVRVQDFIHSPFDVIVCNPPYFHTEKESLKKENRFLKAARHDDYMPLQDLSASCRRLLKDNGKVFLVYRPDGLIKLIHAFEKELLYPERMRIVYGAPDKRAKSVLVSFTKKKNPDLVIERPAFLNDRDSFGWKEKSV